MLYNFKSKGLGQQTYVQRKNKSIQYFMVGLIIILIS